MSEKAASPLLKSLLLRGAMGRRLATTLGAMTIGLGLLLAAVLLWWNFRELLQGKASKDDLGSTFLTVSRRVKADDMGHPERTVFGEKEIAELRRAPEVEDVGIVAAFLPQAYMRMELGPGLGFSTDMVLEAVPDRFMDKRPAEWQWAPGSTRVPIILSSSFLSLYNYVFAPSRGLPQFSEETIKALPFRLDVGSEPNQEHYLAQVTGFSDRITSVLVPQAFVEYCNRPQGLPGAFRQQGSEQASRLIVKVKDPSSTAFSHFLEAHNYVTNSELTRFSRLRAIVETVALITGALALLLLGVSLLLFVLFVELTIAKARSSVQLLLEIGYAPSRLKSFLAARFAPMIGGAVLAALLLALAGQITAHFLARSSMLELSLLPGWPVWACAALVALLLFQNMRLAIRRALRQD